MAARTRILWLAAALLGSASSQVALARSPQDTPVPSHAEQTEATRIVARAFLHQLFAEQDNFGAYRKWAAPDFKQHNPQMADGVTGREAFFAARARGSDAHSRGQAGRMANVYNLVLVDGDLFAIHHHAFSAPNQGRVFVDIWRVANGRIVEHWDVIQPYPASRMNPNGMGCGQGENYADALELASSPEHTTCPAPDPNAAREASLKVIAAYTADVRTGDVRGAIARWFTPNYRQHSPNIADGAAGAKTYLEHEFDRGEKQMPRAVTPTRTVAEGDYVLMHRQVVYPGSTHVSTNVDIFRVRNGRISEHWDVKQPVPEKSANANGMW